VGFFNGFSRRLKADSAALRKLDSGARFWHLEPGFFKKCLAEFGGEWRGENC
jgi:hypothetical protein